MKTFSLIALLCTAFWGCAQNPEKEKMTTASTASLTELYKDVRYRDQAVQYHAGIRIGGCAFSFLVNDVPVQQYFEEGNGTLNTSAPLNANILKSGPQTWKLILYPAYSDGRPTETLSSGAVADIFLETLQFYSGGVRHVVPERPLLQTPLQAGNRGDSVFADAGKKMMVYSGTFEATVPYDLTGWSQGVDLRKEDPEKLQREVVAALKAYGSLLQQGDLQKLTPAVYRKEKELAQAFFLDEAGVQDRVNRYATAQSNSTLKVQPLQNYQMKIYGDGRMVTLERTDYPYMGEGALHAFYEDDAGEEYEKTYTVYFYRPQPGRSLEIIR